MKELFGKYIRDKRLLLQKEDRKFSLRQIAGILIFDLFFND